MSKTSFYNKTELAKLGLKSYGRNVLISREASFYGAGNIVLGDSVRIDDFCILSGKITIGSFVHISAYAALYGSKGIKIKDFSGISPRVTIFSATDNFNGKYLIGPLVPSKYTNVTGGKVVINKFVQIGAGSVIMPKVSIGEGAAVGALSFVNRKIKAWTINAGIPVKFIKHRDKGLVNNANRFLKVKE
jgi:galactoside O-acetyltransferase